MYTVYSKHNVSNDNYYLSLRSGTSGHRLASDSTCPGLDMTFDSGIVVVLRTRRTSQLFCHVICQLQHMICDLPIKEERILIGLKDSLLVKD